MGLVGLAILTIGSAWIWIMWSQTAGPYVTSSSHSLGSGETTNLTIDLVGSGIAFYKISIDDFDKSSLFVAALDPSGGVIYQKQIATRVSVNYFDFESSGKYTVALKNVDAKQVVFKAEYGVYGNPKDSESLAPGFLVMIGIVIVLLFFYIRLSGHITAHVV